jgi:Bacterial Ig domain
MRQRSFMCVVLAVGLLVFGTRAASAQALFPGGLTQLPTPNPGPNLLQNNGFENGLTSWTPSGGVAWSVVTDTRHTGNASLRLAGSGGSLSQAVPITQGTYRVSAWVKTQGYGDPADPASHGGMGFRVMFDERDTVHEWPSIPGGFWENDFHGTYDWTYFEGIFVAVQDLTVNIRIWLDGTPVGTAWVDDIKVEKLLPHPIEAFMRYPNYRGMVFRDQSPTMAFDVAVTPPGGDFNRYLVRVALHQETGNQLGAEITHTDMPAAATLTPVLDGSLMSDGQPYRVHISLRDSQNGNAEVYAYPDFRVSTVAGATHQGMKVSFDANNNVMLNGRPRFMLGVYDGGGPHYNANWSNYLWSDQPAPGDDYGTRWMEGLRINSYLNIFSGGVSSGFPQKDDFLNALHDGVHDVMNLEIANCVDIYPAGTDLNAIASDTHVQTLASRPGNMGYYTADECKGHLVDDVFAVYNRLRSLDPSSLAFGALYPDSTISLWAEAADVISTDPYPNSVPGTPHSMVADTARATRLTVHDARPFATVLQFNNAMSQVFDANHRNGFPTKEEMRTDAYMAIVEGAKGLVWWSISGGDQRGALTNAFGEFWTNPDKVALMNQLKAVVGEIADLEPVLITPDASGRLTGWTANGVPQAGLDIPQATLRTKVKVGTGPQCAAPPCAYVLAYNYTNQSNVSAQFTWNTAPGQVRRYPDNAAVSVSGNTFSDTFGPYQAKVYVVGGGQGGCQASITSPTDGSTVSGTVNVDMWGCVPPNSFNLYRDNTLVFSQQVDAGGVSYPWNTTLVTNAQHALYVTVTDVTNTTTTSPTVHVNVNNNPPSSCVIYITSPTAGQTVSGTNWVTIWSENATGAVQDTLYVDGTQISSQPQSSPQPTSMPWDTTHFADGSRTIRVTGTDGAGACAPATVTVSVANGPAFAVYITSPTAGQTISGTNWVTVWSENAIGAVQYTVLVDGTQVAQQPQSSPQPTSIPWNTTAFGNGAHTITVRGVDGNGRTATDAKSVTISN